MRGPVTDPHAICRKWVRRLGVGFHHMEALFGVASDPYECAVMAMADAGHSP